MVQLKKCFGARLRELREFKGLPQQSLADALGVTVQYIGHIEKGRTKVPRPERIELLTQALRCSAEERGMLLELGLEERAKPEERVAILALREENRRLRGRLQSLHVESELAPDTEKRLASSSIPIVSRVAASLSEEVVEYEPIEYEYMDFKNCKALEVTSDSMSPLAFRGQHIIFSETESLLDGCLAYIRIRDGRTLFKRYHESGNQVILTSINSTVVQPPIILPKDDLDFVYRVVGVRF